MGSSASDGAATTRLRRRLVADTASLTGNSKRVHSTAHARGCELAACLAEFARAQRTRHWPTMPNSTTAPPSSSRQPRTVGRCLVWSLYAARGYRVALDLAKVRVVALAAGVEVVGEYVNALTPVECRCLTCGTTVWPRYAAMQQGHRGCKHCAAASGRANAAAKEGKRKAGLQILQRLGFEPLDEYPGKSKPWRMVHKSCGREVSPTLEALARTERKGQGGCKYCSGRATDVSNVVALMREAGFEPLTPFVAANDPWLCRCLKCGRESLPRWATVRNGHGCRWCAGVVLDPDEVRMSALAMGYEPLEPYPGADAEWRCMHTVCGREVWPRWSHLRAGENCCRYCRIGGFDAGAPAYLYLISSETLEAVKVGITKATGSRFKQHRDAGWAIDHYLECRGDMAMMLETLTLHRWRDTLGLPPFVSRDQMPQGGYSETVSLAAVDILLEWDWILAHLERLKAAEMPEIGPRKPRLPKRDWRAERAVAAAQDARSRGLDPLEPFPGVRGKWRMRCVSCDTEFAPTYDSLKRGHGCPTCGRKKAADSRRGTRYRCRTSPR